METRPTRSRPSTSTGRRGSSPARRARPTTSPSSAGSIQTRYRRRSSSRSRQLATRSSIGGMAEGPTWWSTLRHRGRGREKPLDGEAEGALDRALRLCADDGRSRLAVLEQDHRRDRGNAVPIRQLALLVDVDLDELDLTIALFGNPVENRRDRMTRSAPLGPEVDEHRSLALQNFSVEGLRCYCRCHGFLSQTLIEEGN